MILSSQQQKIYFEITTKFILNNSKNGKITIKIILVFVLCICTLKNRSANHLNGGGDVTGMFCSLTLKLLKLMNKETNFNISLQLFVYLYLERIHFAIL